MRKGPIRGPISVSLPDLPGTKGDTRLKAYNTVPTQSGNSVSKIVGFFLFPLYNNVNDDPPKKNLTVFTSRHVPNDLKKGPI